MKYAILSFSLILLLFGSCQAKKEQPLTHSELNFYIVGGNQGKIKRFGTDVSQSLGEFSDKDAFRNFLFALANKPLYKDQIIQTSGLPESKVEDLITFFQSVNVIKKEEHKWVTTLPIITDQEMKVLKENLAPLAYKVSQTMKPDISEIKAQYEKVKSAAAPSWKEVAHLIIDKFLVDGTFHGSIEDLEDEKGIHEYYNESQKALPAFFIEEGKNLTIFGCNWYPFLKKNTQREVYVLHGTLLERYKIPLNQYKTSPHLSSALFRISLEEKKVSFSDQERELFQNLGWIENDQFLVPVLDASTVRTLRPLIDKAGKDAAETVFSNYAVILDSFDNSPYSQFLDAAGDYIQVCYHALFCLIIDNLIEETLLPPIPKPVPDHFGVYITLGSVF